jgi:hypothetical protein
MDDRMSDRFEDIPILEELGQLLARRFSADAAIHAGGADAGRVATPRRLVRRWLRLAAPRVPLLLSTVVTLAVAVIAVGALRASSSSRLHASHSSPPPSPVQGAITNDINKASNDTIAADHACWGSNRGPTVVHGSPGPAFLADLGVLRRPPLHSYTERTLINGGWTAGSRVYVDYIRLARIAYGRAFFLIPEGNPSARDRIPARCDGEMRRALRRLLATNVPRSRWASAFAAQAEGFAFRRRLVDQPGLCFAVVTTRHVRPPSGVSSGCQSPSSLNQPDLAGGQGDGDRSGGTIFAAIVPDRVASVTLEFSAGGRDPGRTLTSHAVNNVVVFTIPARTAHPAFPNVVIRRAASGRILSRSVS